MSSYLVVLTYVDGWPSHGEPETYRIPKGEEHKYNRIDAKARYNGELVITVLSEDGTRRKNLSKAEAISAASKFVKNSGLISSLSSDRPIQRSG